jgi:hypothetical protein
VIGSARDKGTGIEHQEHAGIADLRWNVRGFACGHVMYAQERACVHVIGREGPCLGLPPC